MFNNNSDHRSANSSVCRYCRGAVCTLSGKELELRRIRRVCANPTAQWSGRPIYSCRFLFTEEGSFLNIQKHPEEYPNLIKLNAQDLVSYIISMKGKCSQCEKSAKERKRLLCYRHEMLTQKICYILQEIFGVPLGLKFQLSRHGPTSGAVDVLMTGGNLLDKVLEGKELRIELMTQKEQDTLRTLVDFLSRWSLGELELLTTENFRERNPRFPYKINKINRIKRVEPFVHLMKTQVQTLRRLPRFTQLPMIGSENLAEHVCHVALITMMLCDILKNTMTIDVEKALRKALIHDLEEAATGIDAPTPVKYHNHETYLAIEKTGKAFFDEMIKELPPKLRETYVTIKEGNGSVEDSIVDVADKLDALLMAIEQKRLGNSYFASVIEAKVFYLRNFKDDRLAPLIDAILKLLLGNKDKSNFYA